MLKLQRPPALISVQILRAVACLMVLTHHARNPKPWLFSPLAGWDFTSGVEVFFVISGFIMYATARDAAPGDFLRRRLIRIAPLYALATITWTAWLAAHGIRVESLSHLVLSLLIIPHANPSHPALIWPVLTPGWTLCYEMGFYLLFAVGLAVRRVGAVAAGVILPAVAIGYLLQPQGALPHAATAPVLLAFLGGMGLAWAHTAGRLTAAAAPLGLAGAAVLAAQSSPWVNLPEAVVVAAATALVAGAVAVEPLIRTRKLTAARALGDASYAIYLIHTMVLAQVLWTARRLPLGGWTQFLLVIGAGVGLSVAAGLATHMWVERPMLKTLLRLGQGPSRFAAGEGASARQGQSA